MGTLAWDNAVTLFILSVTHRSSVTLNDELRQLAEARTFTKDTSDTIHDLLLSACPPVDCHANVKIRSLETETIG